MFSDAVWIMTEKEEHQKLILPRGLCVFFCSLSHPTCVNSGFQRLQILNTKGKKSWRVEEEMSFCIGNSFTNLRYMQRSSMADPVGTGVMAPPNGGQFFSHLYQLLIDYSIILYEE